MADQPMDLRSVASGLRRHRAVLVGAAVLGAAIGMALVFVHPPMYASSSLVLLPPKTTDANQAAELVKTDLEIATSAAVLRPASENLRPPMPPRTLVEHVDVQAVTPLVLDIKGLADDPQRAEAISRAVANAHVTYVTEAASSLPSVRRAAMTAREKELRATLDKVDLQIAETTARLQGEDLDSAQGRADATALAKLTAQRSRLVLEVDGLRSNIEALQPSGFASVIQKASPAERSGLLRRYLVAALVGAVVALALGASLVTLVTRRDRRLHHRDDIADAVGSPVVASVHSQDADSVASWISLLRSYTPGPVDAWAWRQALRHLMSLESPAGEGRLRDVEGKATPPRSVAVITLAGDPRGLVAGPQLASFAASLGLRTRLGCVQRHEAAAALWAACSSFDQGHETRPNLWVESRPDGGQELDLSVVLAVVDRQEPKLVEVPASAVVVLALSAGSATAEELARLAVTVDDAGARIRAIVVTDPDNLDRTTGRLLQHDRAQQAPLPSRVTGTLPDRPRRNDVSALSRSTR